jgi:hypothetical protein
MLLLPPFNVAVTLVDVDLLLQLSVMLLVFLFCCCRCGKNPIPLTGPAFFFALWMTQSSCSPFCLYNAFCS